MNEQLLIASLKNDNNLAMEQLFSIYWEAVFDNAFKKVGDEDLAQDITQEIFISLWEKRKHLEIKGSLSGYLYGAVKYKVVNHFRTSAVKDLHKTAFGNLMLQHHADAADENLILLDTAKEIETAIQSLPERMRLIVSLSRKQDKSIKEIALELNISAQTVKNQITAAMKLLRKNLSYILFIAFFTT